MLPFHLKVWYRNDETFEPHGVKIKLHLSLQFVHIKDKICAPSFIATCVKPAPAEIMLSVKGRRVIKVSFHRIDTSDMMG